MADPNISEFSLQSDFPHVPALIRLSHKQRRRDPFCPPSPHTPLIPREVVIDVVPLEGQKGVRQHIDACLRAIEQFNSQQRLTSKGQSIRTATNDRSPSLQDHEQSIHRIDSRLIEDYLSTVREEYQMRDPFGGRQIQQGSPKRSSSVDVRRKQYLQLTLASKVDKRALSNRKPQQPATPNSKPLSYCRTSPRPQVPGLRNDSRVWKEGCKGLRYCINCEKIVESENVQRHELQECKDFQSLYSLSYIELGELVLRKITRMAQELKGRLQWLRTKEEGGTRINRITENTIGQLQEYLKDFEPLQAQKQFNGFRNSLNNHYSETLQVASRLHWFNQIYCQLHEQGDKTKSIGLFREERPMAPLTPIAQLDPRIKARLFKDSQ